MQVAVVGIGGVGSVAAEMLTRCGVGRLLLYGMLLSGNVKSYVHHYSLCCGKLHQCNTCTYSLVSVHTHTSSFCTMKHRL